MDARSRAEAAQLQSHCGFDRSRADLQAADAARCMLADVRHAWLICLPPKSRSARSSAPLMERRMRPWRLCMPERPAAVDGVALQRMLEGIRESQLKIRPLRLKENRRLGRAPSSAAIKAAPKPARRQSHVLFLGQTLHSVSDAHRIQSRICRQHVPRVILSSHASCPAPQPA